MHETTTHKRERFFLYMAWIILFFVMASFGGKAIFDRDGLPPLTYKHHLHAVAMLSWFALFAVQPTLIHIGKVRIHRTLGMLSPLVVATFYFFAAQISLLNWARMGDPLIITANGVNMVVFLGLYVSAIVWRGHSETHKRLMLYASISLLGPAAGRIPEIFDQSPLLAIPFMLGFILTPLIRDLIVRRPHPATFVGTALLILTIPVILGLSGSPGWAAFLESVLGAPGAQ